MPRIKSILSLTFSIDLIELYNVNIPIKNRAIMNPIGSDSFMKTFLIVFLIDGSSKKEIIVLAMDVFVLDFK